MMRFILVSLLVAVSAVIRTVAAVEANSGARNLCTLRPLGGGRDDTDQVGPS